MTRRHRTPDDAVAELATATTQLSDAREQDNNTRWWRRRQTRNALGTAIWRHAAAADNVTRLRVGSDPHRTEESAAKLARWYRRHGFDVTKTTPGEWLCAKINRTPNSAP